MKKLVLALSLLSIGGHLFAQETFTLKSNELGGQATNRQFANTFGCHGQNISPQLSWSNAPAGTQSFAVTIYDKDAPTGSGFWHWLIFNIPANVTELKSDAGNPAKGLAPAGAVQSVTDFGTPGYGGPCPPAGPIHEYLITVYALKTKLELDAKTSPPLVGFNINANTIAKASIVMYAQQ